MVNAGGLSRNSQCKNSIYFDILLTIPAYCQVPHAFQDILGAETTPTLCYSIPAFSAFIERWTDLHGENEDWETIIQPGLDKLEEYQRTIPQTPAYHLAMGKIVLLFVILHYFDILTAIDPTNKLMYYREDPDEFNQAKKLFLKAVS